MHAHGTINARYPRVLIRVWVDVRVFVQVQFVIEILYSGGEGGLYCESVDGDGLANDDGELNVGFGYPEVVFFVAPGAMGIEGRAVTI